MSLPFVHTARRFNRLDDPVNDSDRKGGNISLLESFVNLIIRMKKSHGIRRIVVSPFPGSLVHVKQHIKLEGYATIGYYPFLALTECIFGSLSDFAAGCLVASHAMFAILSLAFTTFQQIFNMAFTNTYVFAVSNTVDLSLAILAVHGQPWRGKLVDFGAVTYNIGKVCGLHTFFAPMSFRLQLFDLLLSAIFGGLIWCRLCRHWWLVFTLKDFAFLFLRWLEVKQLFGQLFCTGFHVGILEECGHQVDRSCLGFVHNDNVEWMVKMAADHGLNDSYHALCWDSQLIFDAKLSYFLRSYFGLTLPFVYLCFPRQGGCQCSPFHISIVSDTVNIEWDRLGFCFVDQSHVFQFYLHGACDHSTCCFIVSDDNDVIRVTDNQEVVLCETPFNFKHCFRDAQVENESTKCAALSNSYRVLERSCLFAIFDVDIGMSILFDKLHFCIWNAPCGQCFHKCSPHFIECLRHIERCNALASSFNLLNQLCLRCPYAVACSVGMLVSVKRFIFVLVPLGDQIVEFCHSRETSDWSCLCQTLRTVFRDGFDLHVFPILWKIAHPDVVERGKECCSVLIVFEHIGGNLVHTQCSVSFLSYSDFDFLLGWWIAGYHDDFPWWLLSFILRCPFFQLCGDDFNCLLIQFNTFVVHDGIFASCFVVSSLSVPEVCRTLVSNFGRVFFVLWPLLNFCCP
eukprot:284817566_1